MFLLFLFFSPGPGIVTRALFKAGVKQVVAAEAMSKFLPYLKVRFPILVVDKEE
jgi:hypothetical protein